MRPASALLAAQLAILAGGTALSCRRQRQATFALFTSDGLYAYLQQFAESFGARPTVFLTPEQVADTAANYYSRKRALELLQQGWSLGIEIDRSVYDLFARGDAAGTLDALRGPVAMMAESLLSFHVRYARLPHLANSQFVYDQDPSSPDFRTYARFAAAVSSFGLELVSVPEGKDVFVQSRGEQHFSNIIGSYPTSTPYARTDPDVREANTNAMREIVLLLRSKGYSFVPLGDCLGAPAATTTSTAATATTSATTTTTPAGYRTVTATATVTVSAGTATTPAQTTTACGASHAGPGSCCTTPTDSRVVSIIILESD